MRDRDLEREIARWRDRMWEADMRDAEVLNELEAHLREAVAQLLDTGMDLHAAVAQAEHAMGAPHALRSEFSKLLEISGGNPMKRVVLGVGVFVLYMVLLAFVCPLLARAGVSEPALTRTAISAILLGIAGSWFAAYKFRPQQG